MVTKIDGSTTCNEVERQVFETEIDMGTVHPAALEPYRVRLFVEDEIVKDAEITKISYIDVNEKTIFIFFRKIKPLCYFPRRNVLIIVFWHIFCR